MSLLIAAAALIVATPDPVACGFAQFSRAPALRRTRETVCIRGSRERGQHEFRLTATERDGSTRSTAASTRTCPAARRVLAEMEALPAARPDVPGIGRDVQTITLDGVGYELQSYAGYGDLMAGITLTSNRGTPLARWVEAMFSALEPCWRRG